MKKFLPHLCVLASGVLWGLIGLFNRRLTGAGVSVGSIVLLRNFGSMLLLGLLFAVRDRSIFRIQWKHLPIFLGTGIVSVLFFTLCYFTCQKLCSLAVAAVLLYTSPAFVVILSAILWRDKLTKRKLLALLLAFLGSTFVTGLWSGSAEVTLWGAVLGVASGLFYGLYSIFGRYALNHYRPFTVTFYTFLCAGLGALVCLRPAELAATFAMPGMVWVVLGLIVVCTVAPYLLYTYGLAGMDSGKAAILASVEPVTAAVVGVLAFGEPMRAGVWLGLACILACVYILK
ncbi:MAG: DMT family transporter [Ruminococcaceae bacterium]|nr:DMT family transporter [Oscillospiraceae bacterium]